MKKILPCLAFLAFFFLQTGLAYSQQIPFQGRLMENNAPVNDTLEIVFSIGSLSWSETHGGVVVRNGLYSVVLGSVNPIPENIFDEVQERSLAITVKGTALSPVNLYPSLAKARTHYTKVLGTNAATDTASTVRLSGGNQENHNIAAYSEAATNAGNISYYGKTLSKAGTGQAQYGVVGQAMGEAAANHIGVYGTASGKGKKNYALYGYAYGEGDGTTGVGDGSYNQGVIAQARGNTWGNIGGFGYAFGDKGVDNIGLVGWSEVNTGVDTTVNNGVVGWARGNAINKGVVGYATGGKENWAGWFEGNVNMQGKYLQARMDSISLNNSNGRQAIVMQSVSGGVANGIIRGFGPNGKPNFRIFGAGSERNNGNLDLQDAEGATKAWLSAYFSNNLSGGLLSMYGPSAGWIGAGFKQWDGETKANLPYISLEGNTAHAARVWMSVETDETGKEFGSLTLSSADGPSLTLNPFTQFGGIPSQGPSTENFLMTGKDWEGKGDYPLFELRGTINSQADGTGYTLPLISLNTVDNGTSEWGNIGISSGIIGSTVTEHRIWMDVQHTEAGTAFGSLTLSSADGKALYLDAYTQLGIPSQGPSTENFLMTGKDWEGKGDYPLFELRGTINSQADGTGYTLPLVSLNTNDNGTEEWGSFAIETGAIGGNTTKNMIYMGVGQHASGQSGDITFRGPVTENVVISSLGWEDGGADRGRITVFGNSARPDGSGGSYNPPLIQMHAGSYGGEEHGSIRLEDADASVYADVNTIGDGNISVGNGTGRVNIYGNGNIDATGTITGTTLTQTSDRRYKENIQPLHSSLNNVRNMKGVSYHWKDKSRGTGRQIGLIAQEVEAVYPEFVHTNEEGYKSVNYASMVAVLIEAVKELEQKISSLEQDKQQLANENASLKSELDSSLQSIHQRMNQLEQLLGQQSIHEPATQASAALRGE